MKIFFRRLHLYLGLASGLFMVLVCLTGTILAFEDELEHLFHAERYTVAPAGPRLTLAQLATAVRAVKPQANITAFSVYDDPSRSVEVRLAGAPGPGQDPRGQRIEGKPGGKTQEKPGNENKGKKGGKGGPRLYVNPYTGAILGELNPRESFFGFVEQVHRGLVAGKAGKTVMGLNSVMLVFILLTGLVLWWPATRTALGQRLQVKWGSNRKRLTHDLHIVLGFYSSLLLLVLALTGIGMSFEVVSQTINALTHSPAQPPAPPASAIAAPGQVALGPDAALEAARQQAPGAESYTVQLPRDPQSSLQVTVRRREARPGSGPDELYIDQYSGQLLRQQAYAAKPLGHRIRGLLKPIHTGAIFGWPTKLLAFLATALGATFPVTGTLLWLNRTRKAGRRRPPRPALA